MKSSDGIAFLISLIVISLSLTFMESYEDDIRDISGLILFTDIFNNIRRINLLEKSDK